MNAVRKHIGDTISITIHDFIPGHDRCLSINRYRFKGSLPSTNRRDDFDGLNRPNGASIKKYGPKKSAGPIKKYFETTNFSLNGLKIYSNKVSLIPLYKSTGVAIFCPEDSLTAVECNN